MMLKVVEVFDIRGRGQVAVVELLDPRMTVHMGAVLGRGDDRWTLVGVEMRNAPPDVTRPRNHSICIRGSATVHRGDVLTVVPSSFAEDVLTVVPSSFAEEAG